MQSGRYSAGGISDQEDLQECPALVRWPPPVACDRGRAVLPMHCENEHDQREQKEKWDGEAGKRLLNRDSGTGISGWAGFVYARLRWQGRCRGD